MTILGAFVKRAVFASAAMTLAGFAATASAATTTATADTPATYTTAMNIAYRGELPAGADAYMAERCRLDFYHPTNRPGYATVVWLHGGGLSSGEKAIPEPLKEKGFAVAAVNYRLYPKAKCPEFIDDAAAAVVWALKNVETYGGDPSLVFVSGYSAGGYLADMVGLDKSYLQKYDADANALAGIVSLSGQAITHFAVRDAHGIPGTQPVVDEYAPLFHVRKDAPPLVLISGDRELEMLGRYEENAYLARMMKVAGHTQTTLLELDGFDHGTMPGPGFELAVKEIIALSAKKRDRKFAHKRSVRTAKE